MYYFYTLESETDSKYYYGSTTNLKRRVGEHQRGEVTATSYRRPLTLVYYEAYQNASCARKRENKLKIVAALELHYINVSLLFSTRSRFVGASPASPWEAGPVAQLVRAPAS